MYNKTSSWYHAGAATISEDGHVITKRYILSGVKDDFVAKYECQGPVCSDMFRSPHEAYSTHRARCQYIHTFIDQIYNEKREFQCISMIYTCGQPGHIHDFNPGPPTYPDGYADENNDDMVSISSGLFLVNSSSDATVSRGSTHDARVITSEPYYYVYWYVLCPGESIDNIANMTPEQIDEGWQSGGTQTEATLSYTFAVDAVTGVWTIVAVSERYSNLSQGSTRSITVTVE